MKIAILGTGSVGRALASKFTETGHEVTMGTRNVKEKEKSQEKDMYGSPSFSEWHKSNTRILLKPYNQAAQWCELAVNATKGNASLEALDIVGAKNLEGKILIDVSNPLDFSKGMPPCLIPELSNTNSLGEEIQKRFPATRVVKTFNTMWNGLMVNPGLIGGGDHVNYISGNDNDAKEKVRNLLKEFGWKDSSLLDLGDISACRATESVLLIWLRVMNTLQTGAFNYRIVN
jgi:predicted dinucleotide-binding enzyme